MTPQDRAELVCDIAAALRESHLSPQLTEEEVQYVKLAIKREAQSIELRQAIIEKTLGGLILMAISGIGYLIIDFFKNHGFK
jgi:hypothetical protein